jgi:aspartate aminotransferase-like enzyme
MANKLLSFVPGPVEIRKEVLQATAQMEMLTRLGGSHRSPEFTAFFKEVLERLRTFLNTKHRVYVSTSSATGLMEAAIRNGAQKRVVNFACGAFSKRWHDITKLCGAEADLVEVDWGQPTTPELVEKHLSTGRYDAMTVVHNETSTGVMNPLEEIAAVAKKYPDVVVLVDCVSSLSAVRVDMDGLGLDMTLAGVQKAFALPPGIAVCTVSDRLFEKSKKIPNRGYYFNFEELEKYAQRNAQTPTTPTMSLISGLHEQLGRMLNEGAEARERRHRAMAARVQDWARERFGLFANEKYLSPTITNVLNTRKEKISTGDFRKALRERGLLIANGYGKLKGECFRVGHMGDLTLEEVDTLLKTADEILGA